MRRRKPVEDLEPMSLETFYGRIEASEQALERNKECSLLKEKQKKCQAKKNG